MIAPGNLARLAAGLGILNSERDFLQLLPGIVVKRSADAFEVIGNAKAVGCSSDNAESCGDCDDAADNKPAAGHSVAPGLLKKRSGAVAGDVDLKVRAGIDVDGLVREPRCAGL